MPFLIVFLCGVFLFNSCGSSLISDNHFQSKHHGEILTGESSQEDVQYVLGDPHWIGTNLEGQEENPVWAYIDFQSMLDPPTVFPALSHPTEPGWYNPEDSLLGAYETLIVFYNKEGIVKKIMISEGMGGLLDLSSLNKNSPHSAKVIQVIYD